MRFLLGSEMITDISPVVATQFNGHIYASCALSRNDDHVREIFIFSVRFKDGHVRSCVAREEALVFLNPLNSEYLSMTSSPADSQHR